MGYVYLLVSLKDYKTYIGSTDNLERRISQHFNGLVSSTRNRLPLKLIYYEEFSSIDEACKKEKYYKGCSGRKKLAIIMASVKPLW